MSAASRDVGAGRRARPRPVGFAEVPAFHVEVARLARPELRERAIVVGGNPRKRGKVVAASLELRARGVVEGMPMEEALARAPAARWVRTDMERARDVSGRLRAAVRCEIEAVELDGLAGFYFEAPRRVADAEAVAERLQARVAREAGLPLRIGVAPARFAARLAAEDAGVAGVRVVAAEAFEDYLRRLSIDRLPGVGAKTATRLAELGIRDVPGLRVLGEERLELLFGAHGRSLWLLSCGEDPKPLRVRRQPTTLSREETFADPERDLTSLTMRLGRLAESLEAALRRDGLRAGRVALRLTYDDARTITRSLSLDVPVSQAGELVSATRTLLERTEAASRPVRRAGLVLAGLEVAGAEDRQLELF